ncbi:hypothetical protein SETIT_8G009300v2 [Setaria italica]|uniref:Uncharacterized protein n=1 Tax=Setaria italica TaxID=4555 RepID=K3ZKS7_SETIT|nr:hypothetical protein SETIT_8G009300v2 [Setaria italica]
MTMTRSWECRSLTAPAMRKLGLSFRRWRSSTRSSSTSTKPRATPSTKPRATPRSICSSPTMVNCDEELFKYVR